MNGSKLLQLIASLNDEQLLSSKEYICSRYKNTDAAKLYNYIINHSTNEEKLSKELVFKHLFPNDKFSDVKVRRLMSQLLKLLQVQIAFDGFSENHLLVEEKFTDYLLQKDLQKQTEQSLERRKKISSKNDNRSSAYHLSLFSISQHTNKFYEKYDGRFPVSELNKSLHHLEQYYLIEKLKIICAILSNRENAKNLVFSESSLQFILQLKIDDKEENISPIIYKTAALILLNQDADKNFVAYNELLNKHHKIFAVAEVTDLYIIGINFCVKKINSGDLSYLPKLLTLYKFSIENGLILVNGYVSPWSYKNTISAALRLKEYDYVKLFIEKFSDKLPEEEKENAERFNKARLHFYKEEYFKVLRLLQEVEYTDVFYSLDAKTLLLKTYYELDELEVMYSLMSSFRQLLNRKKIISEKHRRNYKNFIKYVRKLNKIQYLKKDQLKALSKEIKEAQNIADKNWLIEKVEENL